MAKDTPVQEMRLACVPILLLVFESGQYEAGQNSGILRGGGLARPEQVEIAVRDALQAVEALRVLARSTANRI